MPLAQAKTSRSSPSPATPRREHGNAQSLTPEPPLCRAHVLRHERRDEILFEAPDNDAPDQVPSDAQVVVRERVVRRDDDLETSRPRS